jgi:TonB family protein
MDFDRLIAKHKLVSKPTSARLLLKYALPAVVISAVVVWFAVFRQTEVQNGVPVAEAEKVTPRVQSLPGTTDVVKKEPQAQTDNLSPQVPDEEVTTNSSQSLTTDASIPKTSPEQAEPAEPITAEATQSAYEQAEPVDGYASLYDYFNTNLVYPPESLKDSIEGVQTVKFTINADGKPENIEVISSLGASFENEAKRLIESMPRWRPASLNGRPVSSQMSLPVTFQIKKIAIKE